MALPRSTLVSTLALVGIGFAAVIAMLIFAFSMLRGAGGLNSPAVSPSPAINFPSPTPEYLPNEIYGEPGSADGQNLPTPTTATQLPTLPFGF